MFTTSNRRESWRPTQPDPTLVPSSPKSSATPQVQVISWECEDGYKLHGTRELSQHHNVPTNNIHDLNTSIPSEVRKYPRGRWAPELTLTFSKTTKLPRYSTTAMFCPQCLGNTTDVVIGYLYWILIISETLL